ncbi:MAG: hypothetical protein LH478_03800 [Chitinophagaceae bacterium]|nr:hypothetical protein [Chitinophagaceae bacterium]
MNKIFLLIALLATTTLTQAQSKDSVQLQPKKEKAEIKEADQHRMRMEKEQLQSKPEIVNDEKMTGKKVTKKYHCKVNSNKKS